MRRLRRCPILVCEAEDRVAGQLLTIKEKCILESHRNKRTKDSRRNSKDYPHKIELAIGIR
jgi:hypothetical protein